MQLRREEFIRQFAIPFHVHCLKLWSRRSTAPPYSVARCCYEWIGTTKGSANLTAYEFAVVARPAVYELYWLPPTGQRPHANDRAASLYDALHAAGGGDDREGAPR